MSEKVMVRTCPECGHKHSLGATTQEAAAFVSEVEQQSAEYAQAIAAAAAVFGLAGLTVDEEAAERVNEWLENPIVQRALKEAE